MTTVRHLADLAAAVMPDVASDFAALYPDAPALASAEGARELPTLTSPPRAVWVPWRDDFQGPQKRTAGGQSLQHSLGTRVAGVRVVLWAGSITATEDLAECFCRALLRRAGPGATGVSIIAGSWVEDVGQTTLGESYALTLTYPVDIRAQRATPPANATVTPLLNTSGAGAPTDGVLDSTDL